jgi:dTDP-4-amino-4,6-dideoxygalactose transaminase
LARDAVLHNKVGVEALALNLCARLAIDGGEPIRSAPWPAWPRFDEDELEASTAVLRSGRVNYWTGEEGRKFEREFADAVGSAYGIACSNGTVAIEIILHALGIGPGCDVIVPSRTFVATAHAVALMGARPVFADVDPDSGNITPQTVLAAMTPRTRGVIAVHVGGWPVEVHALAQLCHEQGIAFIEDCAQAHGAKVDGRSVGTFGDAAAFSFCQDKIMTTGGEGGLVTMARRDLWSRAWSRKDHGKSWDAVYERQHPPGFRWLHESVGTNGRLTEMQAAIGRVQLRKLDAWVQQRRRNAAQLMDRWRTQSALRIPEPPAGVEHAHYRLYAYVEPEALRSDWDRDRVMAAIAAEGVPVNVGSCSEIWRERAFPDLWQPQQPLPVAAELGRTSLAFLVHHTAGERDMDDIAGAVEKVLAAATR